MKFSDGEPHGKLKNIGTCRKGNSGTTLRFWPNSKYFDTTKFSLLGLKHLLRAKAFLCPGLNIKFILLSADP